MAKLFKELVRRTFLRKYQNLLALDDVYLTLQKLLQNVEVTGFIDAGASDGRVTKKLLRCFPRATAYAFEPNPLYAKGWQELMAVAPNMKMAPLALADAAGELELHVATAAGPSSFFSPNRRFRENYPDAAQIDHVEKVPIVRLDDWLTENGSPTIQFMKFDIQAAELKAMKGAQKTIRDQVVAIYTEIFFNPMYEGGAIYSEIDLFLREQGFCLYNMYKPRALRNGMLDQGNAIFIHPGRLAIE